ncbi:bi-domain-containing oxidoreductase [Fulvivirga sp.]|uniref:bi-domain-containing oxidoreductase n=1 Tax=Fulvivirga sp. TaxID=1931237 RepID=UPI0032EE31F8
MKQILQSFKTGKTELTEIPVPNVGKGQVLIRTTRSLVSLGTEKMLVDFGKANLLQKARQQPDKVKMVLDKIKTDGLRPTMETVFNKLEQPLPLGYSNVGVVEEIGEGVNEFKKGDRVVSNGPHAEYVVVPKNLVALIPKNVSDDEAAFTVIASIGLQGIRLVNPTLGETVVVTGLGLIGLLTAQLLKANGCWVIGIDIDQNKCDLASSMGIDTINPAGNDPVNRALELTDNIGVDAVIITASTKSNEVISQSAKMCRKRGRVVLVGVIGLELSRADFYEKEITFQVSCSYGPGRYDISYEEKGNDYPIGFVRWTEKRNFETILKAISANQLDVKSLISEIVELKDYQNIYSEMGNVNTVASIINYSDSPQSINRGIEINPRSFKGQKGVLGIVGAGNFTKMTLLPALKGLSPNIKSIVSSKGVNGTALAKKYGISKSATDIQEVLQDHEIDTIIITTRHDAHAGQVVDGLKAGKNVFVEKPLALSQSELKSIENALETTKGSLMVGFNRRFSPHIKQIKKSLGAEPGSINLLATMNAGFIPHDSWVHDLQVGGGRIIGEACHFVDLAVYLTDSLVSSVCFNALGKYPEENTDNGTLLLKHDNGAISTINYFSNGAKSYSKERVEVYSQNRTWIVDNFRVTNGYNVKGFKKLKTKLDKGHKAQFEAYLDHIQSGGIPLIPITELLNVSKASLAAIESLKSGKWVNIE